MYSFDRLLRVLDLLDRMPYGWEVGLTVFLIAVAVTILPALFPRHSTIPQQKSVRPSAGFWAEWAPVNRAGREAWMSGDYGEAARMFDLLLRLADRFRIASTGRALGFGSHAAFSSARQHPHRWWQAQIAHKGPARWNAWRQTNPTMKPDLRDQWIVCREEANLQNIDFSDADLTFASFFGARCTGASFRNADLQDTNLSGTDLRFTDFAGARLLRTNLSGADLTGAFGLTRKQLENVVLSATTKLPLEFRTYFSTQDFWAEWAPLNRAGRDAWIRDEHGEAARLFECLLKLAQSVHLDTHWKRFCFRNYATFPRTAEGSGRWWQAQVLLKGARTWNNWRHTHYATFPDLRGQWITCRRNAELRGLDLSGADLTGAFFFGARCPGVNFQDANLQGADLGGTDLTRTTGLTQTQLNTALGSATTLLPQGLVRPQHWE